MAKRGRKPRIGSSLEALAQQLANVEAQREKLIIEIRDAAILKLGSAAPAARTAIRTAVVAGVVRKKRVMSAAGKQRIAAAQKARWAKVRAEKAKAEKKK